MQDSLYLLTEYCAHSIIWEKTFTDVGEDGKLSVGLLLLPKPSNESRLRVMQRLRWETPRFLDRLTAVHGYIGSVILRSLAEGKNKSPVGCDDQMAEMRY